MTKVIVCGGRDFKDLEIVYQILDFLHSKHHFTKLIQGGASGADYMAKKWAITRLVFMAEYSADWQTHGKAAGVLRNSEMLEKEKPDFVIAFNGGKGTADMVRKARKAGVEVIDVDAVDMDQGNLFN